MRLDGVCGSAENMPPSFRRVLLEHGLVNALVIPDTVPSRRHRVRSLDEWEAQVDAFIDFQVTMGRMMKNLGDEAQVGAALERSLHDTLNKRNWLVHDFFRERVTEFMPLAGHEQMFRDIDECCDLFQTAVECLESIVSPFRGKAGTTDELVEQVYRRLSAEREHDG